MKKASEPQVDTSVPRKFTGWGILAGALVLALFAFLVIGPMVESNSHLQALNDLENTERLERGLRTLCNTHQNAELLNEQLGERTRAERNKVTVIAAQMNCLEQLEPRFRAEHYLWEGASEAVDRAVAQGEPAIEPAIAALEAQEEPEVRVRAMRALTALGGRLNADHRERVAKRMSAEDDSAAARALREVLEAGEPGASAPSPAAPDEPGAEADEGAPADGAQAEEVGAEIDAEDDFQLGGGGLRLKLGGVGAPTPAPRPAPSGRLQLREPSLSAGGSGPSSAGQDPQEGEGPRELLEDEELELGGDAP